MGMFDQRRETLRLLVDMGRGVLSGPDRARGVPHTKAPRPGSPPIDRRAEPQGQGSTEPEAKGQGKQGRPASQTPPGSRHCFKIPGAGPWVRGFHVCAGQLGSDRAIAHVLLHPAIFLTSSINHLAWARDASGHWGGGKKRAGCAVNVVHGGTGGRVRRWEFVMMSSTHPRCSTQVHVIAYALEEERICAGGSPATGQDGIVPIAVQYIQDGDLIVRKTGNSDFSVLSHREGGTGRPATPGGRGRAKKMRLGDIIPALSHGDGREKHHMWRATGLDDTGSWSLSPGAPWKILLMPALPSAVAAADRQLPFPHVAPLHPRSQTRQASGPRAA